MSSGEHTMQVKEWLGKRDGYRAMIEDRLNKSFKRDGLQPPLNSALLNVRFSHLSSLNLSTHHRPFIGTEQAAVISTNWLEGLRYEHFSGPSRD